MQNENFYSLIGRIVKGAITMTDMMVIKGRVMRYPIQKRDEIFFERTIVDSWYLSSLLEREATRREREKLYFKVIKEDGREISYKATFRDEDFVKVLVNIAEIRNRKLHYLYENLPA